MKTLYFTGTGNCLYVARKIGGEALSIPRLMKEEVTEIADEAVGIVCPVYAGDIPKMVHRLLEKVRIRTEYFFMVCTYGMDATVAKAHAAQAAGQAGLRLDYAPVSVRREISAWESGWSSVPAARYAMHASRTVPGAPSICRMKKAVSGSGMNM